ncbi:MAG: tRNA (adenosine(37)-N6)-dimethylallyltransferase MiaA, partial [Parcubacteria group bacterium]|nr:tRNA (adenosine(37)-N6)-dimethylallyltransferase MiaA [Parcubacteria group bacterium]
MPKLVVITGPTCSGKSRMAIVLAHRFSGEIVIADSRQIYRGMDIGTDKTLPAQQDGIPHHLTDCTDPDKPITLQQYKRKAIDTIYTIIQRNHLPLLVGGTGLYIQAVVDNLDIPKVPPHAALRRELEKKDTDTLVSELNRVDPVAAEAIDPKNKRRLIRALEVSLLSGSSFSRLQKKGPLLFQSLLIGISLERATLAKKIHERVDGMMEAGLVAEVMSLVDKGYDASLPSMSGIGYREIVEHLHGSLTLSQAVERIRSHTRQLARKQLIWLRR